MHGLLRKTERKPKQCLVKLGLKHHQTHKTPEGQHPTTRLAGHSNAYAATKVHTENRRTSPGCHKHIHKPRRHRIGTICPIERNICRPDPTSITDITCLALLACGGCSCCSPPSASDQSQMDAPPKTPRSPQRCLLLINHPTTNPGALSQDLTPTQCSQQSNDATDATITHGFHRKTRTNQERCRIPSMAPPTRKTTPKKHRSPSAPTNVGHDFRPGTRARTPGKASPTHHHQTRASTSHM